MAGVMHVSIRPGVSDAPIDVDRISQYLARQNRHAPLLGLEICSDTTMRNLPCLHSLNSLHSLCLGALQAKNFQDVKPRELKALRRVELWGGTERDVDILTERRLEELVLIRTRAPVIKATTDKAWIVFSRNLRSLASSEIRSLELESCSNFEYSTLGEIRELKKLELRNSKLDSLEFVAQLDSLKSLVICGDALVHCDLKPLLILDHPIDVGLFAVAQRRQAQLFKENPQLRDCSY